MPDGAPLIHAEFTDHFHPKAHPSLPSTNGLTGVKEDGDVWPLSAPPSCTQILLNPLRLTLERDTIRWLQYVALDVANALVTGLPAPS